MALEKIGLGAIFTFDGSQGIAGMRAAGSAATSFGGALSRSLSGFGMAAGVLGVATAPIAAAMGLGVKKAAEFEHQMAALSAVSNASAEEMKQMSMRAKEMGTTTIFSATESGKAMEYLSRAGFNVKETMDALPGVLAAAAADGMDLAQATDITSNVLRSMHLEADQAVRVADVLALVSAKTNTNIRGLGGSFRYAAAQAVTMGIDFETTAASLGVISDSGLDATAGGTAFTNMLVQLSRPSKKAGKMMNEIGAHMHEFNDGTVDVVGTVKDFHEALAKIPSRTKRAQYATEIFGVRGQKAFNALAAGLDRVDPKTGKNKLVEMIEAAYGAQGSAATMAEKRLGSFKGAWMLFTNAMETFAIETMGLFLGPMTKSIRAFTKELSSVALVLMQINAGTADTAALTEKYGKRAVDIALGISAGFKTVLGHIDAAKQKFLSLMEAANQKFGSDTFDISRIATIAVLYAGMLSPLLIGFRAVYSLVGGLLPLIMSVLSPIFSLLSSLGTTLAAGISLPVVAALAVIVYAWYNARDQFIQVLNGIIEMFVHVWDVIKESALAFWDTFIELARPAIDYFVDSFRTAFHEILSFFKRIIDIGIQTVDVLKPLFVGMFEVLGWIMGRLFQGLSILFGGIVQLIKPVADILVDLVKFIVEDVVNALRAFVRGIVKVSDAINVDVAQGLREFGGDLNRPTTWRLADTGLADGKQYFTANDITSALSLDRAAQNKAEAAKPPKLEANVQVENKQQLDIHNCMKVDGRELAIATARHTQEVNERAGFKATRWQQKFSLEQGAQPIPGAM